MRKPVCFVCGKEADHQIGETYVCLRCAREDVLPTPRDSETIREMAQKHGSISANDAAGRWLREHDPDLKRSSKGN